MYLELTIDIAFQKILFEQYDILMFHILRFIIFNFRIIFFNCVDDKTTSYREISFDRDVAASSLKLSHDSGRLYFFTAYSRLLSGRPGKKTQGFSFL